MQDLIGIHEDGLSEINNIDQNDQVSMNKDELSSRVNRLLATISQAEKELYEIRSGCNHKDRSVKQLNVDGSSSVRIICDTCQSIVGYPTIKQIDEWKDN